MNELSTKKLNMTSALTSPREKFFTSRTVVKSNKALKFDDNLSQTEQKSGLINFAIIDQIK